jgi:hypothetical protein
MGWIGGRPRGFWFGKENLFIPHGAGVPDGRAVPSAGRRRAEAREAAIDDLFREGLALRFDYDFGGDWRHKVEVEKILDDYPDDYPRVIKYVGNCPPKGVRGPAGYKEFLRILSDPSDPNYKKTLKWGRFQLYVEYDPDRANAELMDLSSRGYRGVFEADDADDDGCAGPHSFLAIADRLQTMREDELKKAFANPETLFGYLIFEREPVFDLHSLLESFRFKELQDLASQMDLPGRSGLRKSELIEVMYDCYTNSTLLHIILSQMEEDQIPVLRDIMRAKIYYVKSGDFPYEFALTLLLNLVVTAFYDGNRIAIVALKESKEKYAEALDEMREIFNDILDELDTFACAAVNLYGVIAMKDFMSAYASRTESDLDEESARKFLSDLIEDADDGIEYRIRGDLLISEVLEDWSDDEITELHEKSQMYPFRVPPKEQFQSYVDWIYFEKTPAHSDFIELIRDKIKPDAEEAARPESVVGEVCAILRQWAPIEECFDVLESFGVVFDDPKESAYAAKLLSQMFDDTRVWGYNGATPNEVFSDKSGRFPYKNPERKIGRNDPCPCGSGRKYKHCCGRLLH